MFTRFVFSQMHKNVLTTQLRLKILGFIFFFFFVRLNTIIVYITVNNYCYYLLVITNFYFIYNLFFYSNKQDFFFTTLQSTNSDLKYYLLFALSICKIKFYRVSMYRVWKPCPIFILCFKTRWVNIVTLWNAMIIFFFIVFFFILLLTPFSWVFFFFFWLNENSYTQ